MFRRVAPGRGTDGVTDTSREAAPMAGDTIQPAGERGLLARIGLPRRELRAWAMYDWALSALQTTVLVAVFPIFFVRVAGADVAESRATQALATEYCVKNKGKLSAAVHKVPDEVEHFVAGHKLASMGIEIDSLTDEQKRYMSGWEQGT